MKRLRALEGAEGGRCSEVGPEWRLSCLHELDHPEYALAWELLIRKCRYFATKLLAQKALLSHGFTQEDLEQELLLHTVWISKRPSYVNLTWDQFSRLLTVSLPNHAKNLSRLHLTDQNTYPLASFTPEEERRIMDSLLSSPIRTIHLEQAQVLEILKQFMEGVQRNILSQLSQVPPVNNHFENRAQEILFLLREAKANPGRNIFSILESLGYHGVRPRGHLMNSILQCLPSHVSGQISAVDFLQLAWAS